MKSRIATFIISIVFFLIFLVFLLFGIILWDSLVKLETSAKPQNMETVFSDVPDTIEENIKTPEILENPFENIKDNNDEKQVEKIDYSNVTIDKFFYNQLEDYSKIIYKAFETNKEKAIDEYER